MGDDEMDVRGVQVHYKTKVQVKNTRNLKVRNQSNALIIIQATIGGCQFKNKICVAINYLQKLGVNKITICGITHSFISTVCG